MDKAALAAALEKMQHHTPGDTCALTPDETKTLQIFVQSRRDAPDLSPKEKALHKKIVSVLEGQDGADPTRETSAPKTGERRSQNVLRNAIEKAQTGNWEELSPDEINLMRETRDTIKSRGDEATEGDNRLIGIFDTVLGKYDEYLAEHPADESHADPASASSSGNGEDTSPEPRAAEVVNTLNAKKDFNDKLKTPMSILEDVQVDINVRTFEYEGETLLTGDIPTDVLLHIRGGGITVEGFVAGNIAASGDITIKGNLQGGTVISNNGNISLERSLLNSKIIAKKGSVTCQHLEAPKCAFAWDTLTVEEDVLGGTVSGNKIHVHGKIASGEIHTCGEISAKAFEIARNSAPVICLLDALTCEDYLRSFDDTTNERRQRMRQLDSNMETARHRDRSTNQLIHDSYRTALFYLLGGVQSATLATGLQGLNTRSVYLRQILSVADGVTKYYGGAAPGTEEQKGEDLDRFKEENVKALSIIQKEVEGLPDEFGSAHRRYLLDRCAELNSMIKKLHDEFLEERSKEYLQYKFNPALTKWRGSLGECDREIRTTIAKFGIESELLERIENEPDSLEKMLDEIVAQKLEGDYPENVGRVKSPLVRLLKESAGRYGRSIEKSRKMVQESTEELEKIRGELTEDSAVLFGDPKPGSCSVRAGHYTRGTILTTKPGNLEGFDSQMAKVIVLADDIKSDTTFQLEGQLIRRQT